MPKPTANFETYQVSRYWIATTPDGRKALVLDTVQGRPIAFELPPEVLPKMAADLATLAAQTAPPSKPNA